MMTFYKILSIAIFAFLTFGFVVQVKLYEGEEGKRFHNWMFTCLYFISAIITIILALIFWRFDLDYSDESGLILTQKVEVQTEVELLSVRLNDASKAVQKARSLLIAQEEARQSLLEKGETSKKDVIFMPDPRSTFLDWLKTFFQGVAASLLATFIWTRKKRK